MNKPVSIELKEIKNVTSESKEIQTDKYYLLIDNGEPKIIKFRKEWYGYSFEDGWSWGQVNDQGINCNIDPYTLYEIVNINEFLKNLGRGISE